MFSYTPYTSSNFFYPVVDCKKLEKELGVFYKGTEMHNAGLVKTLLYIEDNNLSETFKEKTKLLSILVTIPMSTP